MIYLVGFLSLFLLGKSKGLFLARLCTLIGISKDFIWINLVYLYENKTLKSHVDDLFNYKLMTTENQVQMAIKIVIIWCLQTYS